MKSLSDSNDIMNFIFAFGMKSFAEEHVIRLRFRVPRRASGEEIGDV